MSEWKRMMVVILASLILMGALSGYCEESSPVGAKQVLFYVEWTDIDQEFANTLTAINSVSTDYVRTDLSDYTQLDAMLVGKDVLAPPPRPATDAGRAPPTPSPRPSRPSEAPTPPAGPAPQSPP